ncbi:Sucrase/ferredoxin-like-domain-containing protein [Gloeopeniophorella convolvens]|nr:Sucrase/ferredoxin-like-domain-containing protein [Gloeopeniophorella convolvens]
MLSLTSRSLRSRIVVSLQPSRGISTQSAQPSLEEPLLGTVPYHKSYLLLHGRQSPRTFPSRFASPLLVSLRQQALQWSALVNVAWRQPEPYNDVSLPVEEGETYSMVAFVQGGARLEIPHVSMANLDEVCSRLQDYMEHPEKRTQSQGGLHLYVCTHGARDCRCGDLGGKVAEAFKDEVLKRRKPEPVKYSSVTVSEIGHVGGHQYAANVLVFPYGDWLGRLRPDDVPGILDVLIQRSSSVDVDQLPSILPSHWRGRMGLHKDEQLERLRLVSHNDWVDPSRTSA